MSITEYILDENNVACPCEDVMEWVEWFKKTDRRVANTIINESRISTVFLGIDHNFGDGEPLLFETMVFGGELDDSQWRCSTYLEAQEQHKTVCKKVEESRL